MKTFKDIVSENALDESISSTNQLYAELRKLPDSPWNTFMADISNALPKPIPTDTLNKALSKMVGRKP